MDRIALRDIAAHGRHGANPGERDAAQRLDIALEMDVDLSDAALTDRLEDTIDYAEVHRRIVAIVAATSYRLLERLAADILEDLFRDRRVARAQLTIEKTRLLDGSTPSVTLRRENPARVPR